MKAQKTALVTGASSGMGKVMAQQLIKDGLKVIVAARRVDKMDDLKALGAYPIALDVSSEESIVSATEEIKKEFGGVDVLVNNAGFGLYGAVEDISMDKARYQLEVNLFGAGHLIQLLLPYMREQRSGKIINISSMGGKVYTPLGAWYHASKHALEGFSDCLRIELKAFNIDVVIVEPGIIQTDFGNVMSGPMREHSGNGPYAPMVQAVETMGESYEKGEGTPPQVIADVVSKAVHSRKPRTRYVAGKFAKPMMFIRKWFGDRAFDRMLFSMMK